MPDSCGELFEQLEREMEEELKRATSYKGLIPSQEFDSVFYQQYLQYATPNELINDIITKETIEQIALINTPDEVIEEIINWYEDECEPKVDINVRKRLKIHFRG